jgi:diguanylate cyclase (GGDEF)-like protein
MVDIEFNPELRVLIVDDDAASRLLAARTLQSAGFSTLTASDGDEALERVRQQPEAIGVIVLDVLLPAMGGFQVLEQLKRDTRCRDIPVILLTAQANEESDVVRGIRVGADDHVQKPFSNVVLKAKVKALCDRRRESLRLIHRLKLAEELAATDALTGLGNRRAFQDQLDVEIATARRHKRPLGLVVFDIDHFKSVNDRFGHPEGDRVLEFVSQKMRGALRVSDQAYRLGGEEFAALLRDCGAEGAMTTAERVLSAVCGAPFRFGGGASERVTLSAGVSVMDEPNSFDSTELFARADRALYQAKANGRRRAVREPDRATSTSSATPNVGVRGR